MFELPVVIFFLVLLRIATPKFLWDHSSYAILAIVIVASVITPTTDVVNMSLFAVPMCLLFFVGVFAGYVLVLHREEQTFPWRRAALWMILALLLLGSLVWVMAAKYHYHFLTHWPFVAVPR
jgi:sec-independent protein translocase protein TatC